jgi:hypothetical protein
MVGMLNQRLAPCYLASFLPKVATQLLGYSHWDQRMVLDVWIRDTLACTHTDMIYFGKQEAPQVFFFSPMNTRPLGRELPSIHMVCKCRPDEKSRSNKKKWIVKHRGHEKMALNTIFIHIKCSQCGKGHGLTAKDHEGVLVKVGGLFAAVVPVFLS